MKRIIFGICIMLLMVGALSGCISETAEYNNPLQTKYGKLIDVVYHRGWFDIPNSVELFFFDKTTVKINDEWFYNNTGVLIEGVERDVLYSFCKYNIGEYITIIYDIEEGLCYSINV